MALSYKMRFDGQAHDAKTNEVKRWRNGDVITGEFSDLLPDTYLIVKQAPEVKPQPRPVTTKRKATRKVNA